MSSTNTPKTGVKRKAYSVKEKLEMIELNTVQNQGQVRFICSKTFKFNLSSYFSLAKS